MVHIFNPLLFLLICHQHAGVGEAMDPAPSDASIVEGARLEAPLWLATPLAAQQMATMRYFDSLVCCIVVLRTCGHP